ncbi:hypothetical protein [Kitasatospora purpeofusca]|uniref:hypothetical protein n=1 Tax=Kitasatospora purpeofusca TaxID=67352 RepID=UPI00367B0BF4
MHTTPSAPGAGDDLEDLRQQKAAAQAEQTRLRGQEEAIRARISDLDERIAAADLRAALDTDGPAGLIRRWSALVGRSPGLDGAVRTWLAQLHPGLAWNNRGRGGRAPVFPVHLWADPDGAAAAAEALDGMAPALRAAQERDAGFPRLEVRVMKPRHDPPLLMSPFADAPAATLTLSTDGWNLGTGSHTQSTEGSCLPLLALAIRMGIDARAAEPARR